MSMKRKKYPGQALTVPASAIKNLVSDLGLVINPNCGCLTICNTDDTDSIEIGTTDASGNPPVTGSMAIIPAQCRDKYDWGDADLASLYVKSLGAGNIIVYVFQESNNNQS